MTDQKSPLPLSVLMISTDPGFFTEEGTGDVIYRHVRYAERVKSLDVIVLGVHSGTKRFGDRLTVHGTGTGGIGAIFKARQIARTLLRSGTFRLIVTQDPHATGLVGVYLKKKFHLPLIVHLHGDFLDNDYWRRERVSHRFKALVQKRIIRSADMIRVVSDGIRRKLLSAGISDDRIAVIGTPINDELFTTLSDDQKMLVEKLRYKYQDRFVLMFCGRLVPAKNLLFLLTVIDILRKRHRNILLLLVGEGEMHQALERTVKDRNLESHVVLLGALPHEKLTVYYHVSQLFVLLSTNESFGKVIIEAGLSGVPCVASRTTGASSIIAEGRTGFIVGVNDLDMSVAVIEELMEYPEHVKMLGENAKALYRNRYAMSSSVDKIIDLWKRVSGV